MKAINRIHTALAAPYHCTRCGRELHWVGDFMRNEVLGLDYDEMSDKENSVVGYWDCECGESYEVTSYSESELEMLAEQSAWDEDEDERADAAAQRDPSMLVEHPDAFVRAVYAVFETHPTALMARNRCRKIVMAREIVSEYLYGTRGLSLWKTGTALGKRTNATVVNLLSRFSEDVRYNNEFQRTLKNVLDKSGYTLTADKHIVKKADEAL